MRDARRDGGAASGRSGVKNDTTHIIHIEHLQSFGDAMSLSFAIDRRVALKSGVHVPTTSEPSVHPLHIWLAGDSRGVADYIWTGSKNACSKRVVYGNFIGTPIRHMYSMESVYYVLKIHFYKILSEVTQIKIAVLFDSTL